MAMEKREDEDTISREMNKRVFVTKWGKIQLEEEKFESWFMCKFGWDGCGFGHFKYAFELILLPVLFYSNQLRSWREEKESLLIKGSG